MSEFSLVNKNLHTAPLNAKAKAGFHLVHYLSIKATTTVFLTLYSEKLKKQTPRSVLKVIQKIQMRFVVL